MQSATLHKKGFHTTCDRDRNYKCPNNVLIPDGHIAVDLDDGRDRLTSGYKLEFLVVRNPSRKSLRKTSCESFTFSEINKVALFLLAKVGPLRKHVIFQRKKIPPKLVCVFRSERHDKGGIKIWTRGPFHPQTTWNLDSV